MKIAFSSPAMMLATMAVSATVAYSGAPDDMTAPAQLGASLLTGLCAAAGGQAAMNIAGLVFGARMKKHLRDIKDQFDVAKQHDIDPRRVVRPENMAGFVRNGCAAGIFMLFGFVGGAMAAHKITRPALFDMFRESAAQTAPKPPIRMAHNTAFGVL